MDINAERMYPTPFASKSVIFLLFKLLASLQIQKHSPDTTTVVRQEYDYIVVGAGSGGSTVAARLSEEPCVNVLLLEAGKSPPLLTEVPLLGTSFIGSDIDWGYYTTPQKYAGSNLVNRQVTFPCGKVIGGSSILNAMLYVRGSREIYDQWEAEGATGWGYKDVLPYFKKAEMNLNPESIDTDYHGYSGPMTVEKPKWQHPYKSAVEAAVNELGYQTIDVNGRYANGVYDYQMTTRNGQRCSTAKAYLVPAETRKNLDIMKTAFVTKVLIENEKAVGVQFDYNGERHVIRATQEVILSAGTVNTAKLLMLSGIGPERHLREMAIPVIADLLVGKNFHDHCVTFQNYYADELPPSSKEVADPQTTLTYIENRTGILATPGTMRIDFSTNNPHSSPQDVPDFELYFDVGDLDAVKSTMNIKPEVYQQIYSPYENKSLFFCLSQQLRPKSRGSVTLQSADPYDDPLIDPNYFADPEDIKAIVEGMKQCDLVANTHAVRSLGIKPFETLIPGCEMFAGNQDAYYTCHARSTLTSFNHQVGTAKMGDPNDPTTVVDSKLKVKGIHGLRVVDASVMPIVPAGNTNNPTIMVAEKAADIIKEELYCTVPQEQ